MRIRTIGILSAGALATAACGSSAGVEASLQRPPSPVQLSVYVDDSRVSVSPTAVGAGLVRLIVTNQAGRAQALTISARGSAAPVVATLPIDPQGTLQLQVELKLGRYTVATAPRGRTDAQLSRPATVVPATIRVGRGRPGANRRLMLP